MINIAICDDNLIFLKETKTQLQKILTKNNINNNISLFLTGEHLLNATYFDIVCLDIEMNGLNGLEVAKILREQHNNCHIIFISSHQKYVFNAFDVYATNYLLKPIDSLKLEEIILKIVKSLFKKEEKYYSIKNGTQFHNILFSQIYFIEIIGRKITFHTTKEVLTINGKLEDVEKCFPDKFFRTHKSYIINFEHIVKYNKENATITNGEKVPIARRRYAEFGKMFLTFLREKENLQ